MPMHQPSVDGRTKPCPKCRRGRLMLKQHQAVLTVASALIRIGTDPHNEKSAAGTKRPGSARTGRIVNWSKIVDMSDGNARS